MTSISLFYTNSTDGVNVSWQMIAFAFLFFPLVISALYLWQFFRDRKDNYRGDDSPHTFI